MRTMPFSKATETQNRHEQFTHRMRTMQRAGENMRLMSVKLKLSILSGNNQQT